MAVNVDFLRCFEGAPVGRETIWTSWEEHLKSTSTQWFSSIESAIETYYNDHNRQNPEAELCALFRGYTSTNYTANKRWRIFSTALDNLEEEWGDNPMANDVSDSSSFVICRALSDAFPKEPFQPNRNRNGSKSGPSPFTKAAGIGATIIVQHMLHSVVNILKEPEQTDVEGNNLKKEIGVALQNATDNGKIGAMKAILEILPSLATKQSIVNMVRLDSSRGQRSPPNIRHEIGAHANGHINHPSSTDSETAKDTYTLQAFDLLLKKNPQLASYETYQQTVKLGSLLIFEHLVVSYANDTVKALPNAQILRKYLQSEEAAQYLIEHGSQLMWDIYCKEVSEVEKSCKVEDDNSTGCILLREAVRHRKVYAVSWILEQCPGLSVLQAKDEYALQALPVDNGDGTYEQIRNLLLPAMLRKEEMYAIRKILDLSKGKSYLALSLGFSTFWGIFKLIDL
jgi:hypothetical protein